MKKYKLDKDEKEILEAIESGKWKARKPTKAELKYYAQAARNTFRKIKDEMKGKTLKGS